MLWTPNQGILRTITNGGVVGTTTPGTGIPSNATTLLDGAVTEVISAAANIQDSWGMEIYITNNGASATIAESAMDILIGGATDDILISALLCGYARSGSDAGSGGYSWFFPLHIPQGKRIAAVFASVRTSITARILITLYGNSPSPFRTGSKVTTYGAQVNNARGQALTIAASGGAATATEMTASTTEDHFALIPGCQPATDTTVASGFAYIGIGIGAAPEDTVGSWFFEKNSGESCTGPFPKMPAFGNYPVGSRLTILASGPSSNDLATDGLIYAVS
jgi:hypothetical protein